MRVVVTLEIDDYVYQFYKKGANILQMQPKEVMENALFMYAGIIADDLLRSNTNKCISSTYKNP